jgi:hypothetical protein
MFLGFKQKNPEVPLPGFSAAMKQWCLLPENQNQVFFQSIMKLHGNNPSRFSC